MQENEVWCSERANGISYDAARRSGLTPAIHFSEQSMRCVYRVVEMQATASQCK